MKFLSTIWAVENKAWDAAGGITAHTRIKFKSVREDDYSNRRRERNGDGFLAGGKGNTLYNITVINLISKKNKKII